MTQRRRSLPRSPARGGAVHHIVMVTFDINVQGRRRVRKREARTLGDGGGEGFPRGSPSARARRSRPSSETASPISLGMRFGDRKHRGPDTCITTSLCPTAEGLLHSCGLCKAGAFFPVARSGEHSARFAKQIV
jgi:hypothetical protein